MVRHAASPHAPHSLHTPFRAQRIAQGAFAAMERFLHVEAFSGLVLLAAAAAALIWANSPWASSYDALWHLPVGLSVGSWSVAPSLHFWINDGLMTLFFLVVGMEIRREIHEGALSSMRQALLPIGAALGGVAVPALVYLAFNHDAVLRSGWAVPTATDIAFAVGVLALLGRGIPGNVRIFLLALAIIDDVIAVLIIALFYSGGLAPAGFAGAALGVLMVLGMQRIGAGSAWAYVLPGAVLWGGILMTGAHPTLAGVVLGLMTPVRPGRLGQPAQALIDEAAARLRSAAADARLGAAPAALLHPRRQLLQAQRELVPPVSRVQMALHPWVAFGVMPIFALANAGVQLGGDGGSTAGAAAWVTAGVALALVAGKPLGIVGVSWLMVRGGLCRLPPGVDWGGIWLVGLLAGIGFTMSIFIAMLAFTGPALLGAAKLGVLGGSVVAAVLGLGWGWVYRARQAAPRTDTAAAPHA